MALQPAAKDQGERSARDRVAIPPHKVADDPKKEHEEYVKTRAVEREYADYAKYQRGGE